MAEEIKWNVREYYGTHVFKYDAADHPNNIDPNKLAPITEKGALAPGDMLLVPAVTGGYYLMKVDAYADGSLFAQGDKLMASLEFGRDDRNAWVCVGIANLRGLEKLKITV